MFVYCGNNPVINYDPSGRFFLSTLALCVIGGALIGAAIGGVVGNTYANNKGYTGEEKANCIIIGVFGGGIIGGVAGYFAAPAITTATGVAGISISSAGVSTVAAAGTSFGTLGTLITNNGQQMIDWGKATFHGLQRMAERGVTQNMVEAWVKTGKALQQTGDKILYITRQGAAVVDKAGRVITAYTNKYFDANMQKIIEKLFGK